MNAGDKAPATTPGTTRPLLLSFFPCYAYTTRNIYLHRTYGTCYMCRLLRLSVYRACNMWQSSEEIQKSLKKSRSWNPTSEKSLSDFFLLFSFYSFIIFTLPSKNARESWKKKKNKFLFWFFSHFKSLPAFIHSSFSLFVVFSLSFFFVVHVFARSRSRDSHRTFDAAATVVRKVAPLPFFIGIISYGTLNVTEPSSIVLYIRVCLNSRSVIDSRPQSLLLHIHLLTLFSGSYYIRE